MQNNTFPVFPDNGIIRFVMLPEMSKKSFVLLGSTYELRKPLESMYVKKTIKVGRYLI